MELLSNCPVCSGTQFNDFLETKDFLVSHETFKIVQCTDCGFRFTNPRPSIDEIGKYYQSENYISHSNTKRGIINFIYQIARRFTIKGKVSRLKRNHPAAKNILDYGCGTGEFLLEMKHSGFEVWGIEQNDHARFAASKKINVFAPDQLYLFENQQFDIVSLWHVLEHIHSLNEVLTQFHRILKSNGRLIVAVPICDSFDARYYKEMWAALDLPRHLYHFNLSSLGNLFGKKQMEIKSVHKMPLDGFYVSALSEKYRKSAFGFLRAIFIGTIAMIRSYFQKSESSSLLFIIQKK